MRMQRSPARIDPCEVRFSILRDRLVKMARINGAGIYRDPATHPFEAFLSFFFDRGSFEQGCAIMSGSNATLLARDVLWKVFHSSFSILAFFALRITFLNF